VAKTSISTPGIKPKTKRPLAPIKPKTVKKKPSKDRHSIKRKSTIREKNITAVSAPTVEVAPTFTYIVTKQVPKWDESYPYLEETFKVNNETFQVAKYFSLLDKGTVEFEKFLFEVIRVSAMPNFVKNNFKKIKKLIEKEVQHRSKMLEKLSKEQKMAFTSYFQDSDYFSRSSNSEYFEHELDKVYVNYLKAYCETGIYEARARLGNKKRRDILSKHNIIETNG
jgi:hypothetical protein